MGIADPSGKYIVLFDGVCNLCNRSVQFIIKRDKKRKFLFASLQGEAGQSLLKKFKQPSNQFNSFILVEGNVLYTRSTAALRVLKHLGRGWQLLYTLIIIPPFIRDAIYKWIAANRYKWFGKTDVCRMPLPEEKEQFLD